MTVHKKDKAVRAACADRLANAVLSLPRPTEIKIKALFIKLVDEIISAELSK